MERDCKGAAGETYEKKGNVSQKPSKLSISRKHFPEKMGLTQVTELAAD